MRNFLKPPAALRGMSLRSPRFSRLFLTWRTTTQSSQCNENFGASTKFRLRWGYLDLNYACSQNFGSLALFNKISNNWPQTKDE
jgi:hypothetical protein